MTATRMPAITAEKYGPPENLKLREVEKPALDADRVVIRVRAASINPYDCHSLSGSFITRLSAGLRRPKRPIPGTDVAGVVESVGENVTDLRPGDEIFGGCPGSLAEYALGGKNFIPMPSRLTFEQAAAVPLAGLTALQGLRDKGQIQAGQTVLINGASGGVGTLAVQIAKAYGAEVTGVCSTKNVELLRSIGADHVIDYTKEDFARTGERYDVVFDLVGNRSLTDLRRAAKPEGTVVLSGGGHERGHGSRSLLRPLAKMARAKLQSPFVSQKVSSYMSQFKKEDLLTLRDLIEAGKLTPVIDRSYPLRETPAAFRHLLSGHARGKIVITV